MGIIRRLILRYRGWEYWNTYFFEWPIYLIGMIKLVGKGLGLRDLCKANWSLDHGGFSFASKYEIQRLFNQDYFPKTILINSVYSVEKNVEAIGQLQKDLKRPFPLILKPDNGRVGKGVVRAQNAGQLAEILAAIEGAYIVQEYCDLPYEAGIFVYRRHGKTNIFSMNAKELPHVIGDGRQSVLELINGDDRLQRFLQNLSGQINFKATPGPGEKVLLSYIGNHAQGSVFFSLKVEDSASILESVDRVIGTLAGFNYGRLDVKSASIEDFNAGKFTVLEVNGIDSLSTNIFDPSWTIFDAYIEIYRQYSLLIELAHDNVKQNRNFATWKTIVIKMRESEARLDRNHKKLLSLRLR